MQMKTKKNDTSIYFKEWTTKKLKEEYKSYHELIYRIGCYGTSDMRSLYAIEKELASRNVEIYQEPQFN